jgi:hypothetical protein
VGIPEENFGPGVVLAGGGTLACQFLEPCCVSPFGISEIAVEVRDLSSRNDPALEDRRLPLM